MEVDCRLMGLYICYHCNYIYGDNLIHFQHKCTSLPRSSGELTGWIQRQQTGNKR